MIDYIRRENIAVQLPRAVDFRLLNRAQEKRLHCALRLNNEVDVLYRPFVEGDRPIQGVVAHVRRGTKSPGEFRVYAYLTGQTHVIGKTPFHALFSYTVNEDVVLHILLRTVGKL